MAFSCKRKYREASEEKCDALENLLGNWSFELAWSIVCFDKTVKCAFRDSGLTIFDTRSFIATHSLTSSLKNGILLKYPKLSFSKKADEIISKSCLKN